MPGTDLGKGRGGGSPGVLKPLPCKTCPQEGDLRRSGPPSGQGAGGGDRTRYRRIPADLRADSLAAVPPTPLRALISQNIETAG
ncbi:hypothetical protein PoB_000296800 [Plakobranchus ocellatus]|uniref:Uncharacterized protein n=1 Tax=Plakobranchus ocellatus TaxID=259542 RepID=A0AAV3Y2J7_9GAST|nr:hypothetical protein PoB_000296800 [Plakobranchus ocellatus]